MDFELVGDLTEVETIATARGNRELPRLRRLYGRGRWRKMKVIARIRLRAGRTRLAELHWLKHMASAKKNSSARGISMSRVSRARRPPVRRLRRQRRLRGLARAQQDYVVLPDKDAESEGDLRVVDESGEDYLFSADRFVAIDVPAAVKASLLKAS